MSPRKFPDTVSFYFIGISLLGLCLLAALTFNTPKVTASFAWQNQLIGSVFGAICLLGMVAGISPLRCSRMLHFGSNRNKGCFDKKEISVEETTIGLEGHHPSCGNFSAHVFQAGNQTYCAGCTGLVTGAIISLFGSFSYFFAGFHVGEVSISVFWLGFVWVACGLLQYSLLKVGKNVAHLFLNVILVLGALLLLIGVNEISGNLVLEVYFLTLIVYWILARIMLSGQEHKKICTSCGTKSCRYTLSAFASAA